MVKKSLKLKIDILTLFPDMFLGPFDESIIKRGIDKNLVEIKIHNLRDWTKDKHKTVDDRPYGGGVGMILKPEPIFEAVEQLRSWKSEMRGGEARSRHLQGDPPAGEAGRSSDSLEVAGPKPKAQRVILLSPQGQPLNQRKAEELSKFKHLILICGHYEGVDERVREHLVDEEISIGDYVLTGGEIPAMVLTDAVVRLIPGVLEKPEALTHESFQFTRRSFSEGEPPTSHLPPPTSQLLEFPQYTRPENFRGYKVPEVLLSGDHKKIAAWRSEQSLLKTRQKRPDLLK